MNTKKDSLTRIDKQRIEKGELSRAKSSFNNLNSIISKLIHLDFEFHAIL